MFKGFMAFDGSKNNSKRKGKSISCSSRMKTSCNNTVLKYSPHLLGGYKQKIKTLSENNKALVEALENYRYQCSEKEKTLIQVSTAALQNSISAKAKLNKLATDLKEILLSVEDIISLVNTNSTAYPTTFVRNLRLKKPRDCLSQLIESISEETDWDDFSITKPHSSLGVNGNCMENGNKSSSLLPTKRIAKSERTNRTKIPSIQKLNKAEVLETPSESLSRQQDFSSDVPKSLKRRRNPSEGLLHRDLSNWTTPSRKKLNPPGESEKTVKKNEHHTSNLNPEPSVDETLLDPIIYVINTDQPQANSEDVIVEEFYATNNVLGKPHEGIALQKNKKSKVKLDSKAGKTKRHAKKNLDEYPSINTISDPVSERTKIKVASLDEEKIRFGKSNVGEALQETVGSRKRLRNKQILCSVENVSCDVAVKTTVTAEVHKPPSDKLAEKKPFSPNVKIMQPCVVLTDIRDTSLLIERDGDGFVKVPNKEDGKKKRLKGRKKKSRGSLPSRPESSRSCRSKPVISYKENSLNKKMRRS